MTYTYKRAKQVIDPITLGFKAPNGVVRIEDNAHIPCDPNNKDWQEYLEWEAAGNTPVEWT
tara:strand:- start:5642 stop:5824 length:183 start_codon:yes stop_codon:yes gene_type:complete